MSFHRAAARADATSLPPEIAFLEAAGIASDTLARAAALARASGCDAATAALHHGLIGEDAFYGALARRLETRFVCGWIALSEGSRYPQVLQSNAAPLAAGSSHAVIAAPRGRSIARLIEACERGLPAPAITTPTRLREAIFAHHAQEIARAASDDLMDHHPGWSCRPGAQPADLMLAALTIALGVVVANLPNDLGLATLAFMQLAVLAMLSVRLGAVLLPATTDKSEASPLLLDAQLPSYTIMVALYREAKVVPRLIHSLSRLDYPADKLQIIFLLEADDAETAAAFRAAPMPARFEIVVVPDGLPRTKPRALNAALPLARGELLVVYDAEDVVDPRQLRTAATLFAATSPLTAALQGRLVIDNTADGLLPRMFAIEYSALFDVLGPALARWRMPTPLGGTTTHFRTAVLRKLKGWDPWNVTEDADLGMRLALNGYVVGDLPSSTYEEAPKQAAAWLKQRTRWMKGFLQTSFTHGRRPLELWQRLGSVRFLFAATLVPGTVVSALLYPVLTLTALVRWLSDDGSSASGWLFQLASIGSVAVCVAGAGAMLLPGALGCLRRDWPDLLPLVLVLPIYFLLVSLAAWLAVFELARHPHRWNKTEHGLSRSSRSGALHLRRRDRSGATAACSGRPQSPAAIARG